jgi:hypothetical protein
VASVGIRQRAIESLSVVAIAFLGIACGNSHAAALGTAEPADSRAIESGL